MPRKPRENIEHGIYHAFARGIDRRVLYRDDADRLRYLRILGQTATRQRWRCLSYCLMDNHLHLLVETPEANLSCGMQLLQGRYAQSFNARHGRSGHAFQGRYGAVRIKSEEQLHAVAAYIAYNPVEAKLCDRPQDWPWSSYHATIAGSGPAWLDAQRLLSYFGAEKGTAESFQHYIETARTA